MQKAFGRGFDSRRLHHYSERRERRSSDRHRRPQGDETCTADHVCGATEATRALWWSRERRAQRGHPNYVRPELLATAPNQLWSWDITKLKGPMKWIYFHLYVILDVFSRCVVGWMVAHRESSRLAERLIQHTCESHAIPPGQLTLHADRGSSMKSRPAGRAAAR